MAHASKHLGADINEHEKKIFKQRFDIIDTGKDGHITHTELIRLVRTSLCLGGKVWAI